MINFIENLKKLFGLKAKREGYIPPEFKTTEKNFSVEFSPGGKWPKGLKIKVTDPEFLTEEGRRNIKNGVVEVYGDSPTMPSPE